MSKAAVYFDLFNSKAEEFIKELTTSFPDIKQFQTFRSGFSLLKNLDNKKPQDIFNTYVYIEYKDYILKRNEEFFLHNVVEFESTRKDQWLEFIANIRNIWKTLDEDNKDVIWKYFQVLVTLNEKCVNNT
jgi:hypothetical protein